MIVLNYLRYQKQLQYLLGHLFDQEKELEEIIWLPMFVYSCKPVESIWDFVMPDNKMFGTIVFSIHSKYYDR